MKKIAFAFVWFLFLMIGINCKQEKKEDWPTHDRLSNTFRIYEGDILDYKQHDRRNKEKALKFIKENSVPKVELMIQGIMENNPKVIIEMYDEYDIRYAQEYEWRTQKKSLVKNFTLEQFKEKWVSDLKAGIYQSPYSNLHFLLGLKEEILADNARFFIDGIKESEGGNPLILLHISNVKDHKPYSEIYSPTYFYSLKKDFNFKLWTEGIDGMQGEPIKNN